MSIKIMLFRAPKRSVKFIKMLRKRVRMSQPAGPINPEARRYTVTTADVPPTHPSLKFPNCGTGAILPTRDCEAIPEPSESFSRHN